MNKEQIKHLADVIKDMAIGQFLFFGGKNIFLYAKSSEYDWGILILSAMIYLCAHVIIHAILSQIEDK